MTNKTDKQFIEELVRELRETGNIMLDNNLGWNNLITEDIDTAWRGIIQTALKQREEEEYIQGFIDGFMESGEGYNGEYTHSRYEGRLQEHLRQEAKDTLKQNDK